MTACGKKHAALSAQGGSRKVQFSKEGEQVMKKRFGLWFALVLAVLSASAAMAEKATEEALPVAVALYTCYSVEYLNRLV